MSDQNTVGYEAKVSWWVRLFRKLYPSSRPALPDDEEGWAPGHLESNTVVVLDWKDRLRLAFGGNIRVITISQTDVKVGKIRSTSSFYVTPPRGCKRASRGG